MNFTSVLNNYQKEVNEELEKYFKQKKKELPNFGNSFVKEQLNLIEKYCLRDGKRLRPILTLIAYQAVGGKNKKDILFPALAFELYHNYTLIHDDIYDEDELRRGELANHVLLQKWFEKKYRINIAKSNLYKNAPTRFGVVAGFINGKYLETLSGFPILEAKIENEKKIAGLRLIREVSIYDNTGQAIDLVFELESIEKIREKDYYNMVLCKTGRLFKASIEWGAILGGASEKQIKALRKYADELSLVFQIKDDLLDIASGGDKSRGIGSDIKKGKKTLLMIHALKNSNRKEKKEILKIFGKNNASEKEIREIIKLLHDLGSVDYCEKIALRKAGKSIEHLRKSSPGLKKYSQEFMEELAYFMFKRDK